MSLQGLYDRKLTIYRYQQLPDGQGGFTDSVTLLAVTSGRARPLSSREVTQGGLSMGSLVLRFYMDPLSEQPKAGDEIRIDDEEKSYKILGPPRDPALLGLHWEIDAERKGG